MAENAGSKDCVVIDTSIWRTELLLRTPVGVSLVYTLGRQGGLIGLPEVVERELTSQIVEHGLDAAECLAKSSRIIYTLTDSPFAPESPDETTLAELVEARLAELSPILVRVPFTLEHASAALDMVQAKLPPNGKNNQQFKDSAIWQAVLSLLPSYRVHFATNDRAFLRERNDPTKGLAPTLEDDCRRMDGTVGVYCDLGSCLKAITSDTPSFDKSQLVSLITAASMTSIRNEATRLGFEIGEPIDSDVVAFKTRVADRLAIDYSLTMRFDPRASASDRRINCRAKTHGSCYFDRMTGMLSEHFVAYAEFIWDYPSGGHGKQSRTFRTGDHPSIPFPRPMRWE